MLSLFQLHWHCFNGKIVWNYNLEWIPASYISFSLLSSSDSTEIRIGPSGAGGSLGKSWDVVFPAQAFTG